MVALTVLSFLLALLIGVLIIRWRRYRHAAAYGDVPQRFHVGNVPRLGGLAVVLALGLAWSFAAWADGWLLPLNVHFSPHSVSSWLAAALPVVAAGIAEDLTQRMTVRWRLFFSCMSGVFAVLLMGLAVPRLGIAWLDAGVLVHWPWLGMVLAVFAIAGLPHAFNLIDGYNGLAGTVALFVSLAIAHVALQVGDRTLAGVVMCLAGATSGFLVWNYPRGLIFAGDGGAYLWGVVIAMACVALVQRHAEVSPWFPALLLIYPVWETFFSIYRKLARGGLPGVADALHFHQLIYRRIVRGVFHEDEARQVLKRNNRTSPYLWGFTLLTVAPAVLFWRSTPVLVAFCVLFVATYVGAYLAIVRFKVPGWFR